MTNENAKYLGGGPGFNSGDWGNDNRGWSDGPSSTESTGIITDEQGEKLDGELAKIVVFVFCLALIVAAIPLLIGLALGTGIAYGLFRFARYRPKFIMGVSVIISLVMAIVFLNVGGIHSIMSGYGSIPGLFKSHMAFGDVVVTTLKSVAPSLFSLGMIIGPWVGVVLIEWQVRKMRNSPWLIESDNLASNKWMHDFTYRMTPFEAAREKKIVQGIKNDTYRPYGRNDLVPLGIEEEILNKSSDPLKNPSYQVVCRSDDEVPKHTIVTGAAGSGKTVTLKSMMMRDIKAGKTIFVIDCKKDPEVAEFLSRETEKAGGAFYHYSADLPYKIQGNPAGPSSYDPIAGLSPSKRVDMLLSTREWDAASAVWRGAANDYLFKVFATLDAAEGYGVLDGVKTIDTSQGEMWTFVQMLDKNVFNSVVKQMNDIKDNRANYIRQQASKLNADLSPTAARTDEGKRVQSAHTEYQSRMSSLMVSPYGRWLKGGDGGGSGKIINVADLSSRPGNVVLFSIDAATKDDTGSVLGSIICTDLANMTETRKNKGESNPVAIYIDEFQSLPPECVKSMLQKARSAGVGLTLALQSLEQITATVGNESYVKSLLDTCSNFIFHAGSTFDTGMEVAKIIGQHDVTKYMIGRRNETKIGAFNWLNNRDLQVSQHVEKEWVIDPSSLQALAMPSPQNGYRSEAIIVKKAPDDPIDEDVRGASAHKVHMIAPDDTIHEWFDVNGPEIDIDAPLEIRIKSKGLMEDIKAAHKAVMNNKLADDGMMPSPEPVPETMEPGVDDGQMMEGYSSYRRQSMKGRASRGQAPGVTRNREGIPVPGPMPASPRTGQSPTSARAMRASMNDQVTTGSIPSPARSNRAQGRIPMGDRSPGNGRGTNPMPSRGSTGIPGPSPARRRTSGQGSSVRSNPIMPGAGRARSRQNNGAEASSVHVPRVPDAVTPREERNPDRRRRSTGLTLDDL